MGVVIESFITYGVKSRKAFQIEVTFDLDLKGL
jgi:hypothetical protein